MKEGSMEAKNYKNISGVEQLEIPPGETGEREIPQDQEDRMVTRGAIEVVSGETAEPEAPAETGTTSEEGAQPTAQEVQEQKTPEQVEAEKKAAEEAEAQAKAQAQERERGGRNRTRS